MLLRCLQASSSFDEEWTALSSRHRHTGFRQETKSGRTGSSFVGWIACDKFVQARLSNNLFNVLPFKVFFVAVILCSPLTWCCMFSHHRIYVSSPQSVLLHFLQKLFTGRSAWILRRWQRRCAGAPRRTYWGRLRATLTSLLHFMTLLPAETTHSASLKVNSSVLQC